MLLRMHAVVETPPYLADAKAAGLTEAEREVIVDFLASHPRAGDEMRGTGGARKIRFPGRGKGKSGGYRVVTFYSGIDIPVFLMAIFSKGQKTDLTQDERNRLKQKLQTFVENYRKGVRSYVESRKKTH